MAVYSYSKLNTFKRCPFQYKLTYIDKIRTGIENIEAFLGNRFHELMEEVFASGKEKDYFLEELTARFRKLWDQKWHSKVRLVNPEKTVQDHLSYGESCVANFHREYLAPGTGFSARTLGLELKLDFPLDPAGRNTMTGYIDRLAETGEGIVEIQDYKTSAALPSPEELRENRQLAIYQLGLQTYFQRAGRAIPPLRLVLYYVAHSKTYVLESKTAAELEQVLGTIQTEIQKIETEKLFPACVSAFCSWCAYQDLCPDYKKSLPSSSS